MVEGELVYGEVITFVEDVTTTGSTILKAVTRLKEKGVRTDRVVVVVDRQEGARENLEQEGIELLSLVNIKNIKKDSI
jgi:orotate phosphoribosyltransferase